MRYPDAVSAFVFSADGCCLQPFVRFTQRPSESDFSDGLCWKVLILTQKSDLSARRQLDDNRIGQHIVERTAVAFDGKEHDEVDEQNQ